MCLTCWRSSTPTHFQLIFTFRVSVFSECTTAIQPDFQSISKAETIFNTFKNMLSIYAFGVEHTFLKLPWSTWAGGRSDHLLVKQSLERLCKHHCENALSGSSSCKQTSVFDRVQIIYTWVFVVQDLLRLQRLCTLQWRQQPPPPPTPAWGEVSCA